MKNPIRKKFRFLIPNGLPKGPSKSQKSHQICKMASSNRFRELFWTLPFQKWFPSPLQRPPEPHKSWFYLSKTTHFVMPTKKQTRQRNARNRRNHHRKHHRKATCAKLFGAPVSTPISVPKSMQNHSKIDQFSTQIGPKSTSATNFGRLRPFRPRFSASRVDPGSIRPPRASPLGRSWVDRAASGAQWFALSPMLFG